MYMLIKRILVFLLLVSFNGCVMHMCVCVWRGGRGA